MWLCATWQALISRLSKDFSVPIYLLSYVLPKPKKFIQVVCHGYIELYNILVLVTDLTDCWACVIIGFRIWQHLKWTWESQTSITYIQYDPLVSSVRYSSALTTLRLAESRWICTFMKLLYILSIWKRGETHHWIPHHGHLEVWKGVWFVVLA